MIRRWLAGFSALTLVSLGALACGGDDDGGLAFGLRAETVVSNGAADHVSAIAFAPDGRIFYTEQFKGTIRVVNADGTLQEEPFAQIEVADWLGLDRLDWGLTGLALDPDFEGNHFVYAFYTEFVRTVTIDGAEGPLEHDVGQPKIVRMTDVDGRAEDITVVSDEFPETSDMKPGYNANGELHFGPDGYLYASVGDYDLADPEMVMDLGSPVGKLLRMTTDGSAAPGNPFAGDETADPRVFAYGFRDPFPFTFSSDGTVYGTDNTTVSCEELNAIAAGEYYGWPEMGEFPFDDCAAAPGQQPIHHFSREGRAPGAFISFVEVSGLSFLSDGPYTLLSDALMACESFKSPEADGSQKDGVLRALVISDDSVTSSDDIGDTCFGDVRVAPDGTIYYATRNELRKLVNAATQLAPPP